MFDPVAVLKSKAGSSGRPEVTKKLIQIYSPKGAGMKNIIANRVELSTSSLSQENCYVLDTLNELFVYQGKKSSKMAMTAAIDIAARINRMHLFQPLHLSLFLFIFSKFLRNSPSCA